MMWFEVTNNIYGTAENPWDRKRTVGGSSGGEGGIVASRCAPIAIGGDIGGSIRIPAAYNGIYGFKPTSRRTTARDFAGTHHSLIDPIELLIKSARGPLGRCTEDLSLVLRSWWNDALWRDDAYVTPLKFNSEMYAEAQVKKMRIGYFDYNGVFECAGCVKSVIKETKERLERDGHELIPFNTDMMAKGLDLYAKITYAHDPQILLEELQGEEPAWPFNYEQWHATHPWIKKLIPTYVRLLGHKQLSRLMALPRNISLKEFAELFQQTAQYKDECLTY